jgi:hypothetical protein
MRPLSAPSQKSTPPEQPAFQGDYDGQRALAIRGAKDPKNINQP